MFKQIKAIMKKELRDASRDLNSLFSALLYAAMGPVMLFVMFTFIAAEQKEVMENREIQIISQGNAQLIENHFLSQGFSVTDSSKITLYVSDDFEKNISKGLSGIVTLKADLSLNYKEVMLVTRTLKSLNKTIAYQRMIARGFLPSSGSAVDVRVEDSNKVSFQSSMMVKMILIFITTAGLYSSMSIAIDMTSGERERLSLEPLRTQPVSEIRIILGKLFVALIFAFIGTFITLGLDVIALSYAPVEELGVRIAIDAAAVIKVMILLIPFIISLTAIQIAITLFAKSYKEGMTYMMIFTLVVTGINFLPEKIMSGYSSFPYINELVNMKLLLTGGIDHIVFAPLSILLHLTIAAFCVYYASLKIGKERMLG